jgi:hypothetical protein
MAIPTELRHFLQKTLAAVQAEPAHKLERESLDQLYGLLRTSVPAGELVARWLGIVSVRKAIPLFDPVEVRIEEGSHSNDYDEEATEQAFQNWVADRLADGDEVAREWLVPREQIAHRMLEVAEGVMEGTISPTYAKAALEDGFYYGTIAEQVLLVKQPALIVTAAYRALKETLGDIFLNCDPLHEIACVNGRLIYDDDQKAPGWEHAQFPEAKAVTYAAFAFAGNTREDTCDPAKLAEFWQWWLTSAIPETFEKVNL